MALTKYHDETPIDGYKRCTKCGELKPATEEYYGKSKNSKSGFKPSCKVCRSKEYIDNQDFFIEKSRKRYRDNKQEALSKSKEYREMNKQTIKENASKYYQENKIEIKEKVKRRFYKRMETDSGYKLLQRCRKRMYEAVKGHVKSARTKELIGCTVEELQSHIEKQFKDGMTWDNYGKWHVDHIIPCASFDFSIAENQFKCFNYTNLQPLWAIDNYRKHDKIERM